MVIGLMGYLKEKGYFIIIMEVNMKENLEKEKEMVKV